MPVIKRLVARKFVNGTRIDVAFEMRFDSEEQYQYIKRLNAERDRNAADFGGVIWE